MFCSRNCESGSRAVVLHSSVPKDLYEPISRREGTRLSEIPCWLLVPPSSPRLGEGVPPERERLA
ncbi:hypothetical protein DEO72_LG11g2095 [Vigna unguiculata]|uniref:Uncharacterized protein n=1 Tax=Vigna unguiculata TaxID=3917 RepID=A0A4D6NTK6_VIGUN|nr:hypothetical protein DEO72_LG11g2095 [Vigna unguiculata]